MKKSIIAILALAGVASAANELNIPTGGNFFAGNYEFSFTLNEGVLGATDVSDILAVYWGTYSTANLGSNGYILSWSEGDVITLKVGDGAMGNLGDSADVAKITESTTFVPDGASDRSVTFSTALTMGETYTIKNVGANQSQTVSLYKGDTLLETVTYNGNMTGGNADTTMGSVFNADYAVAVPEPATATLSLLALAGLAVRRRRK